MLTLAFFIFCSEQFVKEPFLKYSNQTLNRGFDITPRSLFRAAMSCQNDLQTRSLQTTRVLSNPLAHFLVQKIHLNRIFKEQTLAQIGRLQNAFV